MMVKSKKEVHALGSRLINKKILNSKRAFELAISTLVVIVLATLILAVLIISFTIGWKNFWDKISGYSGSETDSMGKICQSQCDMNNEHSFCCEERMLGEETITCEDDRLNVDCELNCEEACGEGK